MNSIFPLALRGLRAASPRPRRRNARTGEPGRLVTAGGAAMDVGIIGMPTDLGASHRGVELGPAAIRIAGLIDILAEAGHAAVDHGDLFVPQRRNVPEGNPRLRYADSVAQTSRHLCEAVGQVVQEGRFPIVLGGDHSLSIGSVAAMAEATEHRGGRLGVLWLDAHCDLNTEDTTPSGNLHGMALACLLGRGRPDLVRIGSRSPALAPDQVALVGLRSIDPEEHAWIRHGGMFARGMRDIEDRGLPAVLGEALERLLSSCTHLHLSFDMDAVDPTIARGVGTRVHGGLSIREARRAMELVRDTQRCVSLDVVEINPLRDMENETAELAVSLLTSMFTPHRPR